MCNQRLLRKTKKTAIENAARAKKRKSIKRLMRQTKKSSSKRKVDERVTTAKNAIDQATNNNGVDTAKTNGVDAINNVQPTVVKKDKEKQRLIKRREPLKSGNRPNTKRNRRRKKQQQKQSR